TPRPPPARSGRIPCRLLLSSHPPGSAKFKKRSAAHAACNAHADDAILRIATAALKHNVAYHARAAHAVGMADRNRAAIDVEQVSRNAKLVAAVKRLAGECLVEFPQVDVGDLEAMALEKTRDR